MKLIIDIPDKDYEFIKEILCLNFGRTQYKTIQLHVINAIKNGTPYEERPQGEWITVKPHQSDLEDGIDYREECSICHEPNRHYGFDEYHVIRFATYYKTNFCPNCGADMRGKKDDK